VCFHAPIINHIKPLLASNALVLSKFLTLCALSFHFFINLTALSDNLLARVFALLLNFLARLDDLSRLVSVTISLGMVFFLSFSLASDWRKIPCLLPQVTLFFRSQPCAVILLSQLNRAPSFSHFGNSSGIKSKYAFSRAFRFISLSALAYTSVVATSTWPRKSRI